MAGTVEAGPDLSDVQEIRAKLIRRDHILDPSHVALLNRMDRMIVEGDMTSEAFKQMASTVIGIGSALPLSMRKEEAEYRRNPEGWLQRLTAPAPAAEKADVNIEGGDWYLVQFDNDAPRIGSGRRHVNVLVEGKFVHVRCIVGGSIAE